AVEPWMGTDPRVHHGDHGSMHALGREPRRRALGETPPRRWSDMQGRLSVARIRHSGPVLVPLEHVIETDPLPVLVSGTRRDVVEQVPYVWASLARRRHMERDPPARDLPPR